MSYISQVADHLVARSICVSIVGPEVYTMIADWEKKGIPLAVVIGSIDEISGMNGTVDAFDELVSKNFRVWLQKREG